MELNRERNLFFYITYAITAFILLLGSWWIYLMFQVSSELQEHVDPNMISMIKWEGATFILLVFILSIFHTYMHLSDRTKSKSISLFFASLTHELKTPLASIKLQTQVIDELLPDLNLKESDKKALSPYLHRLTQSVGQLENEVDKHLQLARIEREASLSISELEILSKLQKIAKEYPLLSVEIQMDSKEEYILVDEYAFQVILRNLFQNSINHNSKDQKEVLIRIAPEDSNFLRLTYIDQESHFDGNTKKLGQLFYKHNSPKGSGLGLYICKKLILKMKGKILFESSPEFKIHLYFKRGSL